MRKPGIHSDHIASPVARPSVLSGLVALLALLALGSMMGCGPIGPFPGGRLSGPEGSWLADWNRAAELTQIQIETAMDDPSSVNVWVVVIDKGAFIATSLLMGTAVPNERGWVRDVLVDPLVRARVGGVVYPARLVALEDPERIAQVFEAFRTKYPNLDEARGEGARFYRISQR